MSNLTRIQEVAQKVIDPATLPQNRGLGIEKTTLGAYQQKVLKALGITANNFVHAQEVFKALGILVGIDERGMPSIWTKRDDPYQEKFDFSAIRQWM